MRQRFVGLLAAAFPFERKGSGGDDHHHRAQLTGDAGNLRCGTRTRAASEADANENKLLTLKTAAQGGLDFERGFFPKFRVAARAQTFEQFFAQLDFFRRDTGTEHARIGAQQKQTRRVDAINRETLKKVGAGTADADDFDG